MNMLSECTFSLPYFLIQLMPTFRCVFLFSVTDEEWEIDKSELTLLRELGSGQFGVRLSKESVETIQQI